MRSVSVSPPVQDAERRLDRIAPGSSGRHGRRRPRRQAPSSTGDESQSSGFVAVEVRPVHRLGTLGTLARGAQSERPRLKRQSGEVECRGPPLAWRITVAWFSCRCRWRPRS
jgi:hypothetical protein